MPPAAKTSAHHACLNPRPIHAFITASHFSSRCQLKRLCSPSLISKSWHSPSLTSRFSPLSCLASATRSHPNPWGKGHNYLFAQDGSSPYHPTLAAGRRRSCPYFWLWSEYNSSGYAYMGEGSSHENDDAGRLFLTRSVAVLPSIHRAGHRHWKQWRRPRSQGLCTPALLAQLLRPGYR